MASIGAICKTCETYLVLYGNGFTSPVSSDHDTKDMFKLTAEARHKINLEDHPEAQNKIFHCSTDWEFFNFIGMFSNIVRLDIYSHAWGEGLNLGGFQGSREIVRKSYKTESYIEEESCYLFFHCDVPKTRQVVVDETVILNSKDIDWSSDEANNLRRVQEKDFLSELKNLNLSLLMTTKKHTYGDVMQVVN